MLLYDARLLSALQTKEEEETTTRDKVSHCAVAQTLLHSAYQSIEKRETIMYMKSVPSTCEK